MNVKMQDLVTNPQDLRIKIKLLKKYLPQLKNMKTIKKKKEKGVIRDIV